MSKALSREFGVVRHARLGHLMLRTVALRGEVTPSGLGSVLSGFRLEGLGLRPGPAEYVQIIK